LQWCRRRHVPVHAAAPTYVRRGSGRLAGTDPSELKLRAMATIERYLVHLTGPIAWGDWPTQAPMALARKLGIILYRMWVDEADYRFGQPA
jgi:hypothetical protein